MNLHLLTAVHTEMRPLKRLLLLALLWRRLFSQLSQTYWHGIDLYQECLFLSWREVFAVQNAEA